MLAIASASMTNICEYFILTSKIYEFNLCYFSGWDRLHGSDQGCPRKSESWDMLQNCNSTQDQEREIDETSTSMGPRQLSVSSDSRLLDDEIKQEVKVILRPKKPPRPKSEVFLDQVDKRRTKRYSAFGVSGTQ